MVRPELLEKAPFASETILTMNSQPQVSALSFGSFCRCKQFGNPDCIDCDGCADE